MENIGEMIKNDGWKVVIRSMCEVEVLKCSGWICERAMEAGVQGDHES